MKSNHVNLFSFPQQSALDSFIITERTLATNKDGVVSFLFFFLEPGAIVNTSLSYGLLLILFSILSPCKDRLVMQ